jgi:hypothetical protein
MPVGSFDPDWTNGGGLGRPGWATPKTELSIRALAACGRKYFKGQTKHNSEFAEWDAEEVKAVGNTNECFLHKAWLISCIEWAERSNATQITIKFGSLLHAIQNHDRMVDWKAANREKVLQERGRDVVDNFNKAATLARKQNEEND